MNIQLEEARYKFMLAQDLILYLCSVLTYNMSEEQSAQFIADAIATWTTRVESQSKMGRKETAESLHKSEKFQNNSVDVIEMLIQIHSVGVEEIKKEFTAEMLSSLQHLLIAKKKVTG